MPYVGASFALSQVVKNTLPAGVPEAYLKYIAYDQDWKVVASGEQTISTLAQQAWEELRLGYEAQQDGYVEVFVANGSGNNVYFDDIQVKHGQGMVVQENHYYAFGKEIPELHYLNGASKNYRNAYQGQYAEQDEETGWNNFELRMYDSRIGRWLSTDPYGQYASPYVGMGNNPVSGVDPDGGYSIFGASWRFAGAVISGQAASGMYRSGSEWGFNTNTTDGGWAYNFGAQQHFDSKLAASPNFQYAMPKYAIDPANGLATGAVHSNAKGIPKGSTVNVFLNNPSATGIWNTVEKPILQQRGITIIENVVK